jgi:hypothetical protein
MNELVVFISHKLQSSDRARDIAVALSAFGGSRIRMHYSGKYEVGINYRQQIEKDLAQASWLILFYEGSQFEWDWCLYEIGFFTAKMRNSEKDHRLICLHDPEHEVPAPIQDFNSLPATARKLKDFFRQIYVDDPWKIYPDVFQENEDLVNTNIKKIIAAVSKPPPRFAGPSFAIRIKLDQVEILKDGKIPPEADLMGQGGWEAIFGKPVTNVCYKWRDVVRELESPDPWIYPLAALMWQAYDGQRVEYPSVGVRIKFSSQYVDEYRVFRLSLQKVDLKGDEANFSFAAAAVVVPYEPASNPTETRLYHLYNLAWFFRRRLLERELSKLDSELLNMPRKQAEIEKIIHEISNDFRTMLADAQVRGMEQQAPVIQAFASPLREQVKTKLYEEWPTLYDELLANLNVGQSAAERISETLHKMEPINHFFLKVSIEELNKYLGDNLRES